MPAKYPDVNVFNPYPSSLCPKDPCWPRGFPLSQVRNPKVYDPSFNDTRIKRSKIGVVQSLADHEPDVDAIMRFKLNKNNNYVS